MKGHLFIISAPSGTGKSTVVSRVLEKRPDLLVSISFTTRSPRPGEINDKDYCFISQEEFQQKIKTDCFAEWAEVYGNYYGTPKKPILDAINTGKDILLDIDVQGGASLMKEFKDDVVTIFLVPPNEEELKKRLMGRKTDSASAIERRLNTAKDELGFKKYYQHEVINDVLDNAVDDVISIIDGKK